MKLTVSKREAAKKSAAKQLRREGKIPGVIYSRGQAGEAVTVDASEFGAVLRTITKGALPTTMLTLVDADGKERRAIIKGIQYNVTSYDVIHLDFEELHDDAKVNVKVPIEFTGIAACAGVKHGGVLRKVVRHVPVQCLPKDIPSHFELDVADLEIQGTRRIADIAIKPGVRCLMPVGEVAVVISKR